MVDIFFIFVLDVIVIGRAGDCIVGYCLVEWVWVVIIVVCIVDGVVRIDSNVYYFVVGSYCNISYVFIIVVCIQFNVKWRIVIVNKYVIVVGFYFICIECDGKWGVIV